MKNTFRDEAIFGRPLKAETILDSNPGLLPRQTREEDTVTVDQYFMLKFVNTEHENMRLCVGSALQYSKFTKNRVC